MFEKFTITRIHKDKETTLDDLVIKEIPLTINIRNQELVTLQASPSDLKDLAVGFLYTCGLIKKFSDVENIILDAQRWIATIELKNGKLNKNLVFKRLFTSGCGQGVIFYNSIDLIHRKKTESDFKVRNNKISKLMSKFQKESVGFRKTGGVHSAGLSDGQDIIIFREDIGRHNAVDKVIGAGLREKKDFPNTFLLSSGRISSEIVFKVKKTGIPIVVSQSAPTNQAIKLARNFDLTLIGFVRGSRMNIYSKDERLS